MNNIIRVAVQGFSAFERATFESFFRLSKRRTPSYELSERIADSQYVIADADDRKSVEVIDAAGKRGKMVAIGSAAQAGVAAQLPRPINLMAVVKVLDALPREAGAATESTPAAPVQPRPQPAPAFGTAPAADAAAAQKTDAGNRGLAPLSSAAAGAQSFAMPQRPAPAAPQRTAPQPVQPQAHQPKLPQLPQLPQLSVPTKPEAARLDHILVVDDSDIALRFMAGVLERFGFVVHLARSGDEAIARTERQHFSFVFMDVNMPGLDGFKTCKAIKRRDYEGDDEPPTIVMLTSRDTAIDKLRGTMAGCDAYLTKPLDENELLKVIGDREVRQTSYADTAQTAAHH